MKILNKLILLTPKERKCSVFIIDDFSNGIDEPILPFMSVLVNPSLIETNFF